ncbi:ester cyclase [Nocardiopsis trehalosi]|jgi:predicted ester cyclase|uniref:ester cyclase n=1 Tax=Nocardiopsis trehalosi TaxID=109329 RepID=UPI00082CF73B|nr:nuclear transport factor 2 family protein [Nocardiopsis trehalosi]
MTDDDARALYARWLPGMWEAPEGDLDRIAADLFTDDAVGHWGDRDVHGPAAIADQVRRARRLFSDVRTVCDVGPVADGGLLAARWTFTGAYRGGIPGATAAPGTVVRYPGTDLFRLRGGRFCAYWPQGDNLALMLALGAVAPSGG